MPRAPRSLTGAARYDPNRGLGRPVVVIENPPSTSQTRLPCQRCSPRSDMPGTAVWQQSRRVPRSAVASGYAGLLRRPLLEHPDGLRVHFLFGPDTASIYG
jgi:hypothetical protein